MAGSTPNWASGYVPPASEWNALWASKADFSSQTSVIAITTISSLRAQTVSTLGAAQCYVLGYTALSDGGDGLFEYVAGDTSSTDDGGLVIVDASSRRWHRVWDRIGLKLLWWGGSTVSDFAPLLTSALAAVTALSATLPGVSILFPAMSMGFLSSVTFNYPSARIFSLTLQGAGPDSTILNWPLSNGLVLNMTRDNHSFHIRDMTVSCSSTNAFTGLTVTSTVTTAAMPGADVMRCNFRGADVGGTTSCWANCCVMTGPSNFQFIDCNFTGAVLSGVLSGVGVVCQGKSSPQTISVIQNFTDCGFIYFDECITYGDYIQGMTLSQVNMTNVNVGVHQHVGSGISVIGAQLAMNNCQLNGTICVLLEGTIADVYLTGNLSYGFVVNAACISVGSTGTVTRISIVGNGFEGNNSSASYGIVLNGTVNQVLIANNDVFGFINGIRSTGAGAVNGGAIQGNSIVAISGTTTAINLSAADTYLAISGNYMGAQTTGIVLGGNTSHCNVQSNVYNGVTTNSTNAGTSNTIGGGTA
jgi:uncharacterized protein YjbI with pentapeptide repeats